MSTTAYLALLLIAYLLGALPWAVWLGKRLYGVDPRTQDDGNPGAANAFRVGGWRLGAAVIVLDFFKAFLPVFVARWGFQLDGMALFAVMLMPTLGHAFSVFLRFRGGRAIVTLFGVWAGLTLYQMPLVMGAAAIISSLAFKNAVLRTFAVPTAIILTLLVTAQPAWMLLVSLAQLAVLLAKLSVYLLRSKSAENI